MPRLSLLLALTLSITSFSYAQLETRRVKEFSEINVFGPFDIDFKIGPTNVEIVYSDIDTDRILTRVNGDELKIKITETIFKDVKVKLRISSPYLSAIRLDAGASLDVNGILKTGNLAIHVSKGSFIDLKVQSTKTVIKAINGGEIDISGETGILDLTTLSGGVFDGGFLKADRCYTKANTGGEAHIKCISFLEASASTGAKIFVYGNPGEKDTRTSLGGEIEHF